MPPTQPHGAQGGESNPGGNSIRPAEWWKLSDDYATALVLCDELRSKHREASYLVRTLRTSVDGCASDMVDGLGGDERDKRRRSQEAERLREHTKAVSHAAAIAYSDFSDTRGESPLPAVAAAACVVDGRQCTSRVECRGATTPGNSAVQECQIDVVPAYSRRGAGG